jgi:hypothetical protein
MTIFVDVVAKEKQRVSFAHHKPWGMVVRSIAEPVFEFYLAEVRAMKRLLILTVVATLTATSVGCGCGGWFRRGPHCESCPTTGGGCQTSGYAPSSGYVPGPGALQAVPGETYLPAPG